MGAGTRISLGRENRMDFLEGLGPDEVGYRRGSREEAGGVEEGETIIRIDSIRKESIFDKRKEDMIV